MSDATAQSTIGRRRRSERRSPVTGRRAVMVIVGVLAAAAFAPGSASAHSGIQSYVYVSIFDDALDGRVEYPLNDLGPALGIEFPGDADEALQVAADLGDEIVSYTDEHLDLSDGSDRWALRFDTEFGLLETAAGDYLQVPFEVEERFSSAPRSFQVTYSGIIESNPERDALFIVENDWGSATFGNEGDHLLGFSVGAETQQVDIEAVPTTESIIEVATRGSVAVDRSLVIVIAVTGVLGGAVLGDRRATSDVAADGPALRRGLTRAATALAWFALPTITVLGVLGLSSTTLSERLTFGLGAVGVVAAAASVRLTGLAARAMIILAGMASGVVLAESFVVQQLDRSRPVLAFISFALGAVLTVLFISLLLLPLGLLLRRSRRAGRAANALAVLVGIAGLIWLVERVIGVKFPLRTAELTVVDAITSPVVVGLTTALVGGLTLWRATAQPDTGIRPDAEHDTTERIEV